MTDESNHTLQEVTAISFHKAPDARALVTAFINRDADLIFELIEAEDDKDGLIVSLGGLVGSLIAVWATGAKMHPKELWQKTNVWWTEHEAEFGGPSSSGGPSPSP